MSDLPTYSVITPFVQDEDAAKMLLQTKNKETKQKEEKKNQLFAYVQTQEAELQLLDNTIKYLLQVHSGINSAAVHRKIYETYTRFRKLFLDSRLVYHVHIHYKIFDDIVKVYSNVQNIYIDELILCKELKKHMLTNERTKN